MKLIIDTNRIISALLKEGWTREVITSNKFEFYTIDYVMEELRKHKKYILKKAKMSNTDFELLFNLVMDNISIISDKKIKDKMKKATTIMKDIDINDSPILACALSIQNEGIWTEDKHFAKQNNVKIMENKRLKGIYIVKDFF